MPEKKKKSFIVYTDREKQVNMLSDEQAGQLFKSLFVYVRNGKEPDFDNGMLSMAFSIFQSAIDENNAKYDEVCRRNAENGAKGGRPKKENLPEEENPKNPVGFPETENNPNNPDGFKKTLNDTDTGTDTGTGTETKTETEHIKGDKVDKPPSSPPQPDVQKVVELYHEICISFPKVRSLSENRKKAVKARIRTYGIDAVKEVFQKAEASDFLKGKNNRNWSANFDWMMTDSNFCKILDGNYDNKGKAPEQKNNYDIYNDYEKNQDLPF